MIRILVGDCRKRLRDLPENFIHCVVTSPPYYGLRDYGTATWEGGKKDCDHKPPVDTEKAIRKSGLTQRNAVKKGGGVVDKKSNAYMGNAKSVHYKNKCARCGAVRIDHQIGLEDNVQGYVDALVEVGREVRRVLRDDGVFWLNLGDSYVSTGGADKPRHWDGRDKNFNATPKRKRGQPGVGNRYDRTLVRKGRNQVPDTMRGEVGVPEFGPNRQPQPGLKHKDLMGVPWRAALALQADGWYLRMDVIWAKPQPMPESVVDRPTKSHEYIFMLTKQPHYYFDAFAIREESITTWNSKKTLGAPRKKEAHMTEQDFSRMRTQFAANTFHEDMAKMGRNKRSVWSISTPNYGEAHFATFPEELVELCVKSSAGEHGCCAKCGTPWVRTIEKGESKTGMAGSYELRTAGWVQDCKCKGKDAAVVPCRVLDPFGGAGTVGLVAAKLNQDGYLCELNDEYAQMAMRRIANGLGLRADVSIDGGSAVARPAVKVKKGAMTPRNDGKRWNQNKGRGF